MIFLNDILEWLTSEIDYTISVDNVIDNGDGTFTIFVCDTFLLRTGKTIEINSKQYKIIDFEINKWIKIEADVFDTTIKSFQCYPLGYQSGTLRDADKERGSKRYLRKNSVPFIWNRHPYSVSEVWDELSSAGAEIDVEWYLLDVTNPKDYLVRDDEVEVIQPLFNAMKRIKFLMENSSRIRDITSFIRMTPYKELGVVGKEGNTDRLFEENLSGIKIEFSFEVPQNDCFC